VFLDPVLVGIGYMIAYGVWNAVNDMIAGYLSDRTRTRWGRRIPYVLAFSPLMILLFVLLWTPPVGGRPLQNAHSLSIFTFFLLVVFIFEFIYTLVDVGWNALFPEMYQGLVDRSEVAIYRQVFATVGVIITFILAPQLIAGLSEAFGTFQGWTLVGVFMGSVAGGSFLVSLLGSREGREHRAERTLPVKEAFKVTFTNRSFLAAAFLILTTSWIWSILESMTPFIVQYMLGGQVGDITIVGAPLIVFPIISYPIWRKICMNYGTRRTLITSTLLMTAGLMVLALHADTIIEAVALTVFFGSVNGGVQLARELLIPDVIDEDETRTGLRREGLYYGARTFVDRFALALTGASTAFIFSFSRFTPGAAQPPEVILGMRVGIALVLVMALAAFLISAKYYPLGRQMIKKAEPVP